MNTLWFHALVAAPNECCGLIGGRGERLSVYPARSSEPSPAYYNLDLDDLLDITLQMKTAGEELQAIYHSHLHIPAYPSVVDVDLAYYDCLYVIVSLAEEEVRGFYIRGKTIEEVPILEAA